MKNIQPICKAGILYNQIALPENIKKEIELWLEENENSILNEIYERLNISNEKRMIDKIEYYDVNCSYCPTPIYEAEYFDNLQKYEAYFKTIFLKLKDNSKYFLFLEVDTFYEHKIELIKNVILEIEEQFDIKYLLNGKKINIEPQSFRNFKKLLLNKFISARHLILDVYYWINIKDYKSKENHWNKSHKIIKK